MPQNYTKKTESCQVCYKAFCINTDMMHFIFVWPTLSRPFAYLVKRTTLMRQMQTTQMAKYPKQIHQNPNYIASKK